MSQVFISYSRKNHDFVKRLANDLEAEGLAVWYDRSRLKGGMQWAPEIQNAIQQSQYFIVVLSPDSVKSDWVEREFYAAEQLYKKKKLKIIPLLLQKCDIPLWIGHLQHLEVQGKKYELNYKELKKVLEIETHGPTDTRLDCVILCGGISQRLWPLTRDISKVLLPVAGTPALKYVIDFVQGSSAINTIFLSVNAAFADEIRDFKSHYESPGPCHHPVEVIEEEVPKNKEKLGPIGALQYIIKEKGARDLLVLGGDNIFGFALDDFMHFVHKTREFWSCNAVYDHHGRVQDSSEYGNIDRDKTGLGKNFAEKPEKGAFPYLSAACYFFRKAEIEAIETYIRSDGNPDSLGDFVHWLIAQSRLMTWPFSSYWFDVGTREALLRANKHFLTHATVGKIKIPKAQRARQIYVDPGSQVVNSTLGPNVYVGPGVNLEECTIQDSIIMKQCTIQRSEIRNSIIGPGCDIRDLQDLPLDGFIFGPNSRLTK